MGEEGKAEFYSNGIQESHVRPSPRFVTGRTWGTPAKGLVAQTFLFARVAVAEKGAQPGVAALPSRH
jgi:hypothetical protein